MSKDMPSTMTSIPEAESGDMDKVVDKDMGKDTAAVAEQARRRGQVSE